MFLLHTLQPHASRTFSGWLPVGASGDLAPVLAAEIGQQHLDAGEVRGSVRSRSGSALAIRSSWTRRTATRGWALGHARALRGVSAPGRYTLYATGKNYSRSETLPVT